MLFDWHLAFGGPKCASVHCRRITLEVTQCGKACCATAGALFLGHEYRLLQITSMCGKWLSMNVLTLDEKRVVVERHHTSMIKALEQWGFEPVPCDFLHYAAFGGAFHCATLDIRRRGGLESYF